MIKGDIVKLLITKCCRGRTIPSGTTARISYVFKNNPNKFKLNGFREINLEKNDVELVAYVRKKDA
ncbi:hypothetical protein GPEL0_01f2387 [Geoanaerobacter pelophilus]|uniref:Uncharacterized protein n=1 Tax=Geoanaerobacter pelophilus TaxID=60036 RepID=A0ABQ0MIF7_9BACT|nr:hypothetical protein GPEL0_01f2387 [Geoanaerobacter pelophilus]